jgi:hypothetical protein
LIGTSPKMSNKLCEEKAVLGNVGEAKETIIGAKKVRDAQRDEQEVAKQTEKKTGSER